jgi:hypothetical protein
MKAKTFENLIRKVVREEIDYALRREIKTLKEDLRDELKPTIVEHKEKIVEVPNNSMSETSRNSLREKIMGSNPSPRRTFKKQNFTSDNALNDLLNETAMGDTNLEGGNTPGVSIEEMPAPVQNVVNRDYRELMKAIEKKKGR